MTIHLPAHSRSPGELVRIEKHVFAAKVRLARAMLGWSQTELGHRIGLTQRAIHKLEQGETEPRRSTVRALEGVWREQTIEFEDLADGGMRVTIRSSLLRRQVMARSRSQRVARTRLNAATVVQRLRKDRT